MPKIYSGPTGSGKTTILRKKYHKLAKKGLTDGCLVLAADAKHVRDWRNEVKLKQIEGMEIYSYFGFVQQEVKRCWYLIEEHLPGGREKLAPTFMTVEPAHYIMGKLVEHYRDRGHFLAVNATAQQIAVQLIDNLNYAALNDLSLEEVKERLMLWAGADGEKEEVFRSSIEVMKEFKKLCLKERCLDYSRMIKLYNQYLLADEQYFSELSSRYKYLIVDNLERMVPTAQELILKLIPKVKESYFAYNPEGGYGRFFGSAPELAYENFVKEYQVEELDTSYTASEESRELAENLAGKILTGKNLPYSSFIRENIEAQLRGEMLAQICTKIDELIKGGVKPGEIALISPYPDKVLNFTLNEHFKEQDYSLINITRSRLILENGFAQALIVLTMLAKPEWELEVSFSALVKTLNLILKLDPVRSSVLAEEIKDNNLELPDLDQLGLRPRIGFDKAGDYDEFKDWLKEWKGTDFKLEYYFRDAFANYLAGLDLEEEDILACRQLIKSIVNFKEVMKEAERRLNEILEEEAVQDKEADLGAKFIEMINKGTLAADVLISREDIEDKVVLATPYTFLTLPYLSQVKYLFLLDVSSELWLLGGSKELSNPYILSHREDVTWDDQIDQELRREQLADYLRSLLSKVTKGVFLADSALNSRGWEQEGRLANWLREDSTGVMADD